jgi:hypothetical protein
MMNDEFDDLLRDASLSYNPPPEPPREAMWEAIQRARAAEDVTPITPITVMAGRRTPRWLVSAAGIAAVLMVGVVIGRATREPATGATGRVASALPSGAGKVPAAAAADSVDASLDDVATPGGAQHSAPEGNSGTHGGSGAPSTPSMAQRRLAAAQRVATRAGMRMQRDRDNAFDNSGDATAYRLAVVQHLTRTELLLTSFRAQERTASEIRADAQFAAMSKELLGTTRLLLATRRGDDPIITRLLEDLEYVLMQLSQYANEGRRTDLDAINQSLDKTNVIPKLRSNIPAGVPASSGT